MHGRIYQLSSLLGNLNLAELSTACFECIAELSQALAELYNTGQVDFTLAELYTG